jgi:hypothetical protein
LIRGWTSDVGSGEGAAWDKGRRESIRCRATSSSNEGDKVDATRAEWRMDCSVIDVVGSNDVLEATEAKVGVKGEGAGDAGGGAMGEGKSDGTLKPATLPPAIPWRAPTTFCQACSNTLTRSFNSLFSLSCSLSINGVIPSMGMVLEGIVVDVLAAELARNCWFSCCS